jgi:hypothetical protein
VSNGVFVKRTLRLTSECYSKVDRVARHLGMSKVAVFVIAIDNLYRSYFPKSRAVRRKPQTVVTSA